MKEPKRLFESGNPAERAILGFGRNELPPNDLEQKALTAMTEARLAAATRPSSAWPLPRLILTGIVAIGASALVLGLSVRQTATIRVAPPPPVDTAAPAGPEAAKRPEAKQQPEAKPLEARNEVVMTPETLPSAPAAPAATPTIPPRSAAATNVAPAPAPMTSASIAREVELLDGVKAKLGAGEAAEAAKALDGYDAEFPRGTLRPEATVLRVRALLMHGDRAAAEKVGTEFLAKQPAGVHAKRIRALLGEPTEPSGAEKR